MQRGSGHHPYPATPVHAALCTGAKTSVWDNKLSALAGARSPGRRATIPARRGPSSWLRFSVSPRPATVVSSARPWTLFGAIVSTVPIPTLLGAAWSLVQNEPRTRAPVNPTPEHPSTQAPENLALSPASRHVHRFSADTRVALGRRCRRRRAVCRGGPQRSFTSRRLRSRHRRPAGERTESRAPLHSVRLHHARCVSRTR